MLERLQTFFSPQVYPIVVTIVVIGLAIILVSMMRRMVTLALRHIAPRWIDRTTILLQVAVLVGELAIIVSFIAPGWLVVLLAGLTLALVAAALFPGNPISDSVAFLRIRGLRYYRVGDWVTVAGDRYGYVVAIRPRSTLLQTPTQEQVRLYNSFVVGAPIIVHPDPQGILRATVNRGPVLNRVRTAASSLPISNAAVTPQVNQVEAASFTGQVLPVVPPSYVVQAPIGQIARLVKRPMLGKKSIKSLYR